MKENVMEYKGYYTSVLYDAEDQVLHGKIELINDLVTFEAERADEVEKAFHEAVDDYLEMCKALSKEPQKPFRGMFNVRISPKLHRQIAIESLKTGISINRIVEMAIERLFDNVQTNVIDELNASERRIKEAVIVANNTLWDNITSTNNLLSLEVKQ